MVWISFFWGVGWGDLQKGYQDLGLGSSGGRDLEFLRKRGMRLGIELNYYQDAGFDDFTR